MSLFLWLTICPGVADRSIQRLETCNLQGSLEQFNSIPLYNSTNLTTPPYSYKRNVPSAWVWVKTLTPKMMVSQFSFHRNLRIGHWCFGGVDAKAKAFDWNRCYLYQVQQDRLVQNWSSSHFLVLPIQFGLSFRQRSLRSSKNR